MTPYERFERAVNAAKITGDAKAMIHVEDATIILEAVKKYLDYSQATHKEQGGHAKS